MKQSLLHSTQLRTPVFFLLLPVFFVLHGMQVNAGFIPLSDALLLLSIYIIAAFILFVFGRLLFRNNIKAAIASFLLMAFHFFFGGLHDLLKAAFNDSAITKYSVVLPFLFIVLIAIFIWLKRTNASMHRLTAYLNVLLIVLIVWESVLLLIPEKKSPNIAAGMKLPACETCHKPDIYLIMLDEYAGHTALKDLFQFDNTRFEQLLQQKGFHIVSNSNSNYNYTPFSVASTLNMNYLQLQNTQRLQQDLNHAFHMINENQVRRMLEAHGYIFYNHSVFNLPGQPAPIEETFIPAKTRLITQQTFLSRLYRDLGYHLVLTFKIKPLINHQAYRELRNNTRLYDLTMKLASEQHQQPKFVYTHLMMPHYPYYFDRNGKPMDPARVLREGNNVNKKDYVEYLQYVNKKMLELTDHILQNSDKPPVILLMSDHGFRHFKEPVEQKYHFMNLNAIYLPSKDYHGFYNGVSNVNQFRLVFNSVFKTRYSILNDSTIYLKD